MTPEFSIRLETADGCHIITLAGEVDLATASEVRSVLAPLRGRVRIDCSQLTLIDAAGLRSLLEAESRLESLELLHVSPSVRRIFEVTDTCFLFAT